MGGEEQKDYELSLPDVETFDILLHSDWQRFDGKTEEGKEQVKLKKGTLTLTLPAFSGVLLKVYGKEEEA